MTASSGINNIIINLLHVNIPLDLQVSAKIQLDLDVCLKRGLKVQRKECVSFEASGLENRSAKVYIL